MKTKVIAAWGLMILAPGAIPATAESSQPNEEEMFGTPTAASQDAATQKTESPKQPPQDALEITDNTLQVGGRYYQRLIFSGQRDVSLDEAPLSMPLQFDGFIDARPNDRLRGFIDARLIYDPTRDQYSRATGASTSFGGMQNSTTSTAPSSVALTATTPNNPQVVLDQAWLKFDIDHTVFVTAGKQHVKWGSARFWNPTDFLHIQRRDPLLPFDLRVGTTMVKFELPIESKKTNLYGIALFDNPTPSSTLGQVGGAFRAETVFGSTEIGIETVARGGTSAVYGGDVSSSLGPFDVYLEAACLTGAPPARYAISGAGLTPGADLSTLISSDAVEGPSIQVSTGANHQFAWRENRQATVGVEYFYNQAGYNDARVYPALIFFGQYQPFYTGKNYAAFYITAEGPDAERHTSYTFSTLGNLSDRSFLSRLDFAWRILTYLTFEAYADFHYGTRGGEFNFSLQTPALVYQGAAVPAFNVPTTISNMGVGLRMSF